MRGWRSDTCEEASGWSPLCDGELAEGLRAATLEIAAALRGIVFADPSLTGAGGAAVLNRYLARALPGRGFEEAVAPILDRAMDQLALGPLTEALYGGFTGFGWCLEHAQPAPEDDEDANEAIDDALLSPLGRSSWTESYDLVAGLVGIGVYALERAPRPKALECLRLVIERLSEVARRRPDGLTWWSDPRFIGPAVEQYPKGYFNLGLAHGAPGVIALLGQACALPQMAPQARPLLDGAVQWLLGRRLPRGSASCFSWVEEDPAPTRTAWCYGDPASRSRCSRPPARWGIRSGSEWPSRSGLTAVSRPPEETRVIDASLCHGSAGIAHIFNRLYQATGDQRFAEGARDWFRRTLASRKPGRGLAGFLAHVPTPEGGLAWLPDPGFLTGATGVALAMLGAITNIEPNWDRVLLCSIRPGPPRSRGGCHGQHQAAAPFSSAGFFAFRTPLLPFAEFVDWAGDLEAPHAGGDAAQLAAALERRPSEAAPTSARPLRRRFMREALFVASPALDDSFDEWLSDSGSERGQKAERSLTRYFSRMTAPSDSVRPLRWLLGRLHRGGRTSSRSTRSDLSAPHAPRHEDAPHW